MSQLQGQNIPKPQLCIISAAEIESREAQWNWINIASGAR